MQQATAQVADDEPIRNVNALPDGDPNNTAQVGAVTPDCLTGDCDNTFRQVRTTKTDAEKIAEAVKKRNSLNLTIPKDMLKMTPEEQKRAQMREKAKALKEERDGAAIVADPSPYKGGVPVNENLRVKPKGRKGIGVEYKNSF